MNLKLRFSLIFTVLVSSLLGVCFIIVYFFYADYRKDDFYERLRTKCTNTFQLLFEIENIDHDLLKVIDIHTLNALFDEKVLIFDDNNKIIYSSIDDKKITYSIAMLNDARRQGEIFRTEGNNQVLGIAIKLDNKQYVALASAYDKYGLRKMEALEYILTTTFIIALFLTGVLSFIYVGGLIKPLESLTAQIRMISENNLKDRLQTRNQDDEISALAMNFNEMLDRLDRAFAMQKSFVQHASHELRTPIASMIAQTESALGKDLSQDDYKVMLRSLLEDQQELAELVNSLLLLSKYEQLHFQKDWKIVRLDEIIYKSMDVAQSLHPEAVMKFDFFQMPDEGNVLNVKGQDILLQSAFGNLIKNACQYAEDDPIHIVLNFSETALSVEITNIGPELNPTEIEQLFTPFFRGANASSKKGFGLGLSICNRIITLHNGSLSYDSPSPRINRFTIILPRAIQDFPHFKENLSLV
jgi:signal transduction histidine kinase